MRQSLAERRDDTRRRSLFGAFIQTTPEGSVTECVVRDIGAGGARVLLNDAIPLPETFDLCIGERREVRRARLVWRRGDAVGVAFVRPPTFAVPGPRDLLRELQVSKAENAALRFRLADLRRRIEPDPYS